MEENTQTKHDIESKEDLLLDDNYLCESFRAVKSDTEQVQKLKESFSELEDGRHPWFRHVK